MAARASRPLAAAGTVAANSRSVPVLLSAVATWGRGAFRGTDEAQLAATTGVPESLLVLLGVLSLIGSACWVFARVPRRERARSFIATFAGVAVGVAAYLVAGPRLLP